MYYRANSASLGFKEAPKLELSEDEEDNREKEREEEKKKSDAAQNRLHAIIKNLALLLIAAGVGAAAGAGYCKTRNIITENPSAVRVIAAISPEVTLAASPEPSASPTVTPSPAPVLNKATATPAPQLPEAISVSGTKDSAASVPVPPATPEPSVAESATPASADDGSLSDGQMR